MIGSYRRFGNIKYPIPDLSTAINELFGGCDWAWDFDHSKNGFDKWEHPEGKEPPTWEEILEEMEREGRIYNYYLYERQREKKYPKIEDQLDMLYHDIKSGNLENGSWIKSIESVKETYPKPDMKPEEYDDLSN